MSHDNIEFFNRIDKGNLEFKTVNFCLYNSVKMVIISSAYEELLTRLNNLVKRPLIPVVEHEKVISINAFTH